MELVLLLIIVLLAICAILALTSLVIKLINLRFTYVFFLIIYAAGFLISSVYILNEYHRISNMNSAEIKFSSKTGNSAELNFIPTETGDYSIGLKFLNRQEISAMELCSSLAFEEMYSKISDSNLNLLEQCKNRIPYSKIILSINGIKSSYGENYIYIDNKKTYDFSSFLFSKGNTYTLLHNFQFQKGKKYLIKLTIANDSTEILKSETLLTVFPYDDELLTLENNFFIFYLPFSCFFIAMIIFLLKRLGPKSQHIFENFYWR